MFTIWPRFSLGVGSSTLLRDFIALIFPPCCHACRQPLRGWNAFGLCLGCGMAFEALRRRLAEGDHGASMCVGVEPLRLPVITSLSFEEPATTLIHRFKYPRPGLAGLDGGPKRLVTQLILEAASRAPSAPPAAVIPIPLHRRRLRHRGFNPAALLARAVAKEYGLPYLPTALERTRDTPSQTGLGRAQRRANVKGAFRYRGASSSPASVWLVDDVVTTGSTLFEAARVLLDAGSEGVVGLCVAKTPEPVGAMGLAEGIGGDLA